MRIYRSHQCLGMLWGYIGIRMPMDTYRCHEDLWVLYSRIKNIAHFGIQEPEKI